ncbi:hypothetical protein FRC07_009417, partial [Ceratobasidium sp. 392]
MQAGGDEDTSDDESKRDSESKTTSNSGSGSNRDSESKSKDDHIDWDAILAQQPQDMDVDLPEAPPNPIAPLGPNMREDEDTELQEAIDEHGNQVYIEHYPSLTAGEPIRREAIPRREYADVGALLNSESFEIAQLLMHSGMSARYCNCYLRMKRIKAMMPWPTNRVMMQDINKLPHGPKWKVQALEITGDLGVETPEYWRRNTFKCLTKLLQDKQLSPHIQFKPIRKYKSKNRTERVRDEMTTADFAWETQAKIETKDPHGTAIYYIVSSDETRLTTFSGDKKAHPMYLTIANIPKHLRRRISKRANILIGYLPVPKLDCISDPEVLQLTRRNLFHECMKAILQPLEDACK